MIKLLLLLKRIHYVLLFIILESIALYSYSHSTVYTRSITMRLSTGVTGAMHNRLTAVGEYFSLTEQNTMLMEENARLRNEIDLLTNADTIASRPDSLPQPLHIPHIEKVKTATVVRNHYTRMNNFITLNRGANDGLQANMAVFNQYGIIGYILRCTPNFSIALSALNTSDFRTGGRLKGTDFTGSISWDGGNYRYLTIEEVPKYANIKIGDTIVTTFSSIFPDNLPIGTIENYALTSGTFYTARVKMFADMSALGQVYVTARVDQQELQDIENIDKAMQATTHPYQKEHSNGKDTLNNQNTN